jgi:hypothetical protein
MEQNIKLFMVLLGCTPKGRLTEQHDIFFGIGRSVHDLIPQMYAFWPDGGQLHIDSWREVTQVGNYKVTIAGSNAQQQEQKLFFINLGGYKAGEFEEYHYKTLVVASTMGEAVKAAKQSVFFKQYNLKGGGESHIDDKYALEADDLHNVEEVLPETMKKKYSIVLTPAAGAKEDELHIGYTKIGKKPTAV